MQFELKSADGSLNETLLIPKMLVEDIDRTVEYEIKQKIYDSVYYFRQKNSGVEYE